MVVGATATQSSEIPQNRAITNPHCEPSPKSCGKLREAIREETARGTQWKESEEVIARINMRVRGWIGYFHHDSSSKVFGKMEDENRERIRLWLWKSAVIGLAPLIPWLPSLLYPGGKDSLDVATSCDMTHFLVAAKVGESFLAQ